MSSTGQTSRERIMGRLRASLGRGPVGGDGARALDARLAAHKPNTVPARAELDPAARLDLFVKMAEATAASVTRLGNKDMVPGALAQFCEREALDGKVTAAPDGWLKSIPWEAQGNIEISYGAAGRETHVGLSTAFAAIAETGSLMLASGPGHPTTIGFAPDVYVAVVPASRVVGVVEEAWARFRAHHPGSPRAVNMVAGPSRTADIGATIFLGAHGPRQVHIILVEDE